jgi:hypothetical protein
MAKIDGLPPVMDRIILMIAAPLARAFLRQRVFGSLISQNFIDKSIASGVFTDDRRARMSWHVGASNLL